MRIHIYTLRVKQRGGGSHQNLLVFARSLVRGGHEVTVHALFSEGNDPPSDIALQRERGDGRSFLDLQRYCARIMARDQSSADVFLVYGQALVWAGGMYKMQGGHVPVSVYLDSHLDSMKEAYRERGFLYRIKHVLWERTIGRLYSKRIDRYFFTSPYLLERFVCAGFPRDKSSLIANAFDFSGLEPKKEAETDIPMLLYVGRFSHEKGVDMLIDALSTLPDDLRWRAVLAGDGPERRELERMILAAKLSDRIRITGWQERASLAEEYARADVLVMPSRVPEPFGRSIVEAMHVGVPVIVPRVGGAAWVAGESGVVFENGIASSLATAIEKLLRDSSVRRTLGELGKKRARDFDVRVVGRALLRELVSLADA